MFLLLKYIPCIMRTVVVGLHDFKNIALQIIDSSRTNQSFQLREQFEFVNEELGGHCVVIVRKIDGTHIYWDMKLLFYVNPMFVHAKAAS